MTDGPKSGFIDLVAVQCTSEKCTEIFVADDTVGFDESDWIFFDHFQAQRLAQKAGWYCDAWTAVCPKCRQANNASRCTNPYGRRELFEGARCAREDECNATGDCLERAKMDPVEALIDDAQELGMYPVKFADIPIGNRFKHGLRDKLKIDRWRYSYFECAIATFLWDFDEEVYDLGPANTPQRQEEE